MTMLRDRDRLLLLDPPLSLPLQLPTLCVTVHHPLCTCYTNHTKHPARSGLCHAVLVLVLVLVLHAQPL